MNENAAVEKSLDFAVRIVNLRKYLTREHNEYVMSKQLLRCGTSIGANIAEAQRGQSKADFSASDGGGQKPGQPADWAKSYFVGAFARRRQRCMGIAYFIRLRSRYAVQPCGGIVSSGYGYSCETKKGGG